VTVSPLPFERGEYRTLSTAGLTLSAVIFGAFSRIFTLQTSIPAFQHAGGNYSRVPSLAQEDLMSKVHVLNRFLIGTALAAGIPAALAWATTNSGSTSTLVGRATFKSFRVERKQLPARQSATGLWAGEADRARRRRPIWEVEVEARPGLDVATQTITFQPGGHSGWHSHPGPVFISVPPGEALRIDEPFPGNCPF
jgi:hypothetical protein